MRQNYMVHFTRINENPQTEYDLIVSMAENEQEAEYRARSIEKILGWEIEVHRVTPTELEVFTDPREDY